jgi:predicted MFS family arabinose efflux permease
VVTPTLVQARLRGAPEGVGERFSYVEAMAHFFRKVSTDTPRSATSGVDVKRRRLAPLIIATGASQALLVVLAPTMVAMAKDLGTSVSAVAQARTVTAAVAILASVLTTPRIDRIGVPKLLGVGAASASVGCLAVALAPSFPLFLVAHLLVGFGFACLLSAGFAGVAAFPREKRGRAMGYLAAANAGAAIAVNPVVGFITQQFSWRWAMAVPATLAVIALGLVPTVSPVEKADKPVRLITVLSVATARRWMGAELIAYTAWTAFLTFNGAFFIEKLGASETQVGWLLALGPATYMISATHSGSLAERFQRRRVAATSALGTAILLAVLLGGIDRLAWAAALCGLIGLVAGFRTPTSASIGLNQLPDHPGAMMATRTALTQMGYLLGGIIGGTVIAGAGYSAFGIVLAVGLVAFAALILRVEDPVVTDQSRSPVEVTARASRLEVSPPRPRR